LIINPDQAMLDNAYKPVKMVARYLVHQCGIEPIYVVKGKYYFARTCELKQALNRLPLLLQILIDL
jgi:hypothetical protein